MNTEPLKRYDIGIKYSTTGATLTKLYMPHGLHVRAEEHLAVVAERDAELRKVSRAAAVLIEELKKERDSAMEKLKEARRQSGELVEQLAELAHEQWSGWTRYMFEVGGYSLESVGTFTIDREHHERWVRQMNTPYSELSEPEKESDRREARKFLAVIEPVLDTKDTELIELREFAGSIAKYMRCEFEGEEKGDVDACWHCYAEMVLAND
jgi:hypothetical protein